MNKRHIIIGLSAAIAFQGVVLATEYINSVTPLMFGKEYRIKTRPLDPRSLFRGNYARLSYDTSQMKLYSEIKEKNLRRDDVVYVQLNPLEEGLHQLGTITLEPPAGVPFIRGRVANRWFGHGSYDVKFGIEAYFAPKEKALELEREVRRGAIAVVMISSSGKAALKEVEVQPKE